DADPEDLPRAHARGSGADPGLVRRHREGQPVPRAREPQAPDGGGRGGAHMTHLSDESVIDVATGEGRASDREHAAACADCAGRVQASRDALALLQRADVPEPSPLYWEALRSGVRQKIADDRRRVPAWAMLVPLAAAAA